MILFHTDFTSCPSSLSLSSPYFVLSPSTLPPPPPKHCSKLIPHYLKPHLNPNHPGLLLIYLPPLPPTSDPDLFFLICSLFTCITPARTCVYLHQSTLTSSNLKKSFQVKLANVHCLLEKFNGLGIWKGWGR